MRIYCIHSKDHLVVGGQHSPLHPVLTLKLSVINSTPCHEDEREIGRRPTDPRIVKHSTRRRKWPASRNAALPPRKTEVQVDRHIYG
jgi:hypothetical protein